jgi:hypothetical protein
VDLEYYYLIGEGLCPPLPEDCDYLFLYKDFAANLDRDIHINLNSLLMILELAGVRR